MKNCEYIIKTPSGDIKIPANFGVLELKGKLANIVKNTNDINKENLINYIYSISKDVLSKDLITNTIISGIKNNDLKQSIEILNNHIENTVDTHTFERALNVYIARMDYTTNSPEQILEKLNEEIPKSYYSNVLTKETSSSSILNSTNLETEHSKLSNWLYESNTSGLHTGLISELNEFFNYIKYKDNDLYITKNFLQNPTNIGKNSYIIDNFGFYNNNDMLSLFLTSFKKLASKIPNLEPVMFNSIKNKTDLEDSEFDKLLANKDIKKIDEIVTIVSNYLSPNNLDLKTSIKTIFSFIDSDIYSEFWTKNKIDTQNLIDEEFKLEGQLRDSIDNNNSLELYNNRLKLFTPVKIFKYQSHQQLLNHISEKEDMVLIKLGTDSFYNIFPRNIIEKPNGTLLIGTLVQENNIQKGTWLIKPGDEVYYRKRSYVDNTSTIPENNDLLPRETYSSSKKLSINLISNFLSVGDYVSDSTNDPAWLVTKLYGSYAEVRGPNNGRKKLFLNQLYSINSSKLHSYLNDDIDINKYNKIGDTSDITEGDIISDPTTNKNIWRKVAYTTPNKVFVLVKLPDGKIITKDINRADIESAYTNTFETLTISELNTIKEESSKTGSFRNSNMSVIKGKTNVKGGDYYYYYKNNRKVVGKVIDIISGKTVEYEENVNYKKSTNNINKLSPDTVFLTNRDISSTYTLSVLRVNDWDIKVNSTKITDLYVPVKYVVPDNYNGELVILPSNYALIGRYVTNNIIPEGYKDYTSEMKNALSKKLGKNVKSLHVVKVNSNSNKYFNNTVGLEHVDNFSDLDYDKKITADFLKPGVYFSLYNKDNLDSKIYRIVKVNGDTIIAHYNKINQEGKILTEEVEFNKDNLITRELRQNGSIAKLWVQFGNKNILPLVESLTSSSVDEITNAKAVNTLIFKMNSVYSPLGIQVIKSEKGFEGSQRAKIETDSSGKTTIVLHTINGTYSDLIHENLHMFLILLRHTNLDAYGYMLDSTLNEDEKYTDDGQDLNIYDKEEIFVNKIVDQAKGKDVFLYKQLRSFMNSMIDVIKIINPDYEFDINFIQNNPVEFLNKRVTELYDINIEDNSNPFYNLSLIAFEPGYRNWLKENNVILKC